ncbi:hypothetical protein L916_12565 [Phytophthora nicotianae]|uniref:Uncharacterized protein n=1 Tax=Phytophthora nicotianae TaxID=4792 RepID=W2IP21_PHYNI|nr:hypothetical protein L916_12565 [Phytophthora nicotianae]
MSSELQFTELEETRDLLQDLLAFLDDNLLSEEAAASSIALNISQGHDKKSRSRIYSAAYDRCRREKKKAERQALVSKVALYEKQLERLRAQRSKPCTNSKWGWVHAATDEEGRRRKAEEINRNLKGILALQLNTTKILHTYINHEALLLTQRVQSVMAQYSPYKTPKTTGIFRSFTVIGEYLKGMFPRLRTSAEFVFSSTSLAMEDPNLIGALMSSANVKCEDPMVGPCIELLSTTPLPCNFKSAVSMLWTMLLEKKVVGSHAGSYTMKTKLLSECSAEFGYSSSDIPDSFGYFDGVTLFEKHQDDNRAILVWASMLVDLQGKPFSLSHGYLCVARPLSNPQQESVVRSSSRLSSTLFGLSADRAQVNTPVARKHKIASKTRLERAQQRLMENAGRQNED